MMVTLQEGERHRTVHLKSPRRRKQMATAKSFPACCCPRDTLQYGNDEEGAEIFRGLRKSDHLKHRQHDCDHKLIPNVEHAKSRGYQSDGKR